MRVWKVGPGKVFTRYNRLSRTLRCRLIMMAMLMGKQQRRELLRSLAFHVVRLFTTFISTRLNSSFWRILLKPVKYCFLVGRNAEDFVVDQNCQLADVATFSALVGRIADSPKSIV